MCKSRRLPTPRRLDLMSRLCRWQCWACWRLYDKLRRCSSGLWLVCCTCTVNAIGIGNALWPRRVFCLAQQIFVQLMPRIRTIRINRAKVRGYGGSLESIRFCGCVTFFFSCSTSLYRKSRSIRATLIYEIYSRILYYGSIFTDICICKHVSNCVQSLSP